MIPSFSDAGYLIRDPPHPRACFFEKTQFKCLLRNNFFQFTRFFAQAFNFIT
tara:strand:- start:37 stop:192 length:156 start_codon:yes stop_codon:yes gene_type:complete